jgi:hypothetical protein
VTSIAIVIPTYGRVHKLEALTTNIAQTTVGRPHLPLFIVDPDDRDTCTTLHHLNAPFVFHAGTYPQKSNAGFRASDNEVILIAGDDVIFHDGWFDAAISAFDDPEAGVVGGPDLSPVTENGQNVTMPIVRRSYINDPGGAWGETGTVLHEGYHHNWSETELWHLAQHRGRARFAEGCVIEHRHPTWGKGELDDTYQRGAFSNEPTDAALFNRRRSQWQG